MTTSTWVFGSLTTLSLGVRSVRTLVVLVHGLGGSSKTWGKVPELILASMGDVLDVALFTYQSGLVPRPGLKSAEVIAEQLVTDIFVAAESQGYEQIGIAGHSLGGLVAAMAARDIHSATGRPVVTGLLCVGTPWSGVRAARLGALAHPQMRDLASNSRATQLAKSCFEELRNSDAVWVADIHGRADALVDAPPDLTAARYWTYASHRGACSAASATDSKFLPFELLARNCAHVSIVLYLRAMNAALENKWRIRPITKHRASLYELQRASLVETHGSRDAAHGTSGSQVDARRHLDDITALLEWPTSASITGEGGSGKTTAVGELAQKAVDRALASPRSAPTPILLRLNGASVRAPSKRTIAGSIEALSSVCECSSELEAWLSDSATGDHKIIGLFDGLDEADPSQVSAVRELKNQIEAAGGQAILAGRPHANVTDWPSRSFRLDPLDPSQREAIVRRQLGEAASIDFWKWVGQDDAWSFSNPGQLEMMMRLWFGGGHDQGPPRSIGDLYQRALPYVLQRSRDPRELPGAGISTAWQASADSVVAELSVPAFEEFATGLRRPRQEMIWSSLSVPTHVLSIAEAGGLVEQQLTIRGELNWRFTSERWKEFLASRELQRRLPDGEAIVSIARPSCLDVWRMAASAEVQLAAREISPLLEIMVACAMNDDVNLSQIAKLPERGRQLLAGILGGTPGSATTRALLSLLDDESTSVQSASASALKGTIDKRALARLVSMVASSDYRVRYPASDALVGTRDIQTIRRLVELTHDKDEEIRLSALDSLEDTTDLDAIEAIISAGIRTMRTSINTPLRASIILSLREDRWTLDRLIELLNGSDEEAEFAASCLDETSDHAALSALAAKSNHANHWVRVGAVEAMAKLGGDATREERISSTKDPDPKVRGAAAKTLSGDETGAAVDALIALLNDLNEGVQEDAVDAADGSTNPKVLRALVELLKTCDEIVMLPLIEVLKNTKDPSTLAAVVDLLREPEPPPEPDGYFTGMSVQDAAEQILSSQPSEFIVGLTRHEDPKVRKAAIGWIRDDSVFENALAAALDDQDESVRAAAVTAKSEWERKKNAYDEPYSYKPPSPQELRYDELIRQDVPISLWL